MVEIPVKNWKEILSSIDKNDLYIDKDKVRDGKETKPHVTVLYGFHKDTKIKKIKELCKDIKISLSITKMSLFENEKFDVLKFDVKSKDLVDLNKVMKDNFNYTNDYPNYKPHLTIAYLKKGEGQKYIKKIKKLEVKNINNLFYSDNDNKEYYINENK